jgi:hypothetical protein
MALWTCRRLAAWFGKNRNAAEVRHDAMDDEFAWDERKQGRQRATWRRR